MTELKKLFWYIDNLYLNDNPIISYKYKLAECKKKGHLKNTISKITPLKCIQPMLKDKILPQKTNI